MRTAAGLLLTILFVPIFIIGVLAATVRFQVLDSNFWLNTFSQNGVYLSLSSVIKKYAEDKTVSGGGTKSDIRVLTNLVTPENVQDTVSKNLTNVLVFVNGGSRTLDVYVPFDKVPKDLLPTTFDEKNDTVPLTAVLSSLNIHGIDSSQLNVLSSLGLWTWVVLVLDIVLIFTFVILLLLLTQSGRRFWNIGLGLVLSGLTILSFYVLGEGIRRSMVSEWPKSTEAIQRILATFSPFIFQKILFLWLVIGVISIVIGVLLFFIKKRVYNIAR